MKKAKIMLVVITVMAFLGGALAFKAKKEGQLFCTRLIANGEGVCQGSYIGIIRIAPGSKSYYYTTTDDQSACAQAQCISTTFLSTN